MTKGILCPFVLVLLGSFLSYKAFDYVYMRGFASGLVTGSNIALRECNSRLPIRDSKGSATAEGDGAVANTGSNTTITIDGGEVKTKTPCGVWPKTCVCPYGEVAIRSGSLAVCQ